MKSYKDYSGIAIANVERTLRSKEAQQRGEIVKVEMLPLEQQMKLLMQQEKEYNELQNKRAQESKRNRIF